MSVLRAWTRQARSERSIRGAGRRAAALLLILAVTLGVTWFGVTGAMADEGPSKPPTAPAPGTGGATGGTGLAWGYNVLGELGNGTYTGSNVPVPVSLPAGTTITAVAGAALRS